MEKMGDCLMRGGGVDKDVTRKIDPGAGTAKEIL
jgi:hypothetical protein